MEKPTPEIVRLHSILSGIVLHYLAQQKDKESISMKEVDLELIKVLAEQDGQSVEERDGCIVLTDGSSTYGGTFYANNEDGISEAINQLTYNVLHPLSE